MNLQKYYSSTWWKKYRISLTENIDCSCEICGRPRWALYKRDTKKNKKGDRKRLIRISVHHKNYKRLHKEKRDDVMTLCSLCHDYGHMLQRLSVMAPEVYGELYTAFKHKTDWDYEKRDKKTDFLIE